MRKLFKNNLYYNNIIMSSSRSLAAARAKRAGENAPPVSGNRPITSIGSQAAFARQMPNGVGYNMPPPPNNVRTAKTTQPNQTYPNQQPNQKNPNALPFNKLSISDAIGLITLRLGRVEQWIIDTDNENDNETSHNLSSTLPEGHKVIDNATLTTIINRLDSLEKNGVSSAPSEDVTKLLEELNALKKNFEGINNNVIKNNIELAKNTEQVFKFNRELTETKDILKSFMIKYDLFSQNVEQNFTDYESALTDLEKRLLPETQNESNDTNDTNDTNDSNNNDSIDVTNLKDIIKEELSKN